MMQFRKLTDLDMWTPAEVMVHISADQTAILRLKEEETIPYAWRPVPRALDDALRLVNEQPWRTEVVVWLEEAAAWDDNWGQLIE